MNSTKRLATALLAMVILTGIRMPRTSADEPANADRPVALPARPLETAALPKAADKVPATAAEPAKLPPAPDPGHVVGSDLKLQAIWNNGLWVESQHKDFRVHVGGRVQPDFVWYSAPENVQWGRNGTGRIDDAVAIRRARFAIEGVMWEVFIFNVEFDFMNSINVERSGEPLVTNVPVPTDLYGQISYLPGIGNVRIGIQKPPISFEHLTSSRFLNFMERSYGFDAYIGGIDNGFRPGFQAFNTLLDDRITWAIGGFKNNASVMGWNTGDGEWDLTGRLTGLPLYEAEGRRLIHLAVAYSHRDLDDHSIRLRARTQLRNGPAALHAAMCDVRLLGSSQDIIVPELVIQSGPFLLQSEFAATWVQNAVFPAVPPAARVNQGAVYTYSYYVEALYFLTGEHRKYDLKYPRFDRVTPFENFFFVRSEDGDFARGWGAWQVGLRYSYINLNDKGVNGGIAQALTLGLNWFWNPNMKLQWNYTLEHRNAPDTTADGIVQGFGMRYALDF